MNIRTYLTTGVFSVALLLTSGLYGQGTGFVPRNAVYNGLFYETNGAWYQSSGILTLATTARGSYSARLQVGPARYALAGRFNSDGTIVPRQILRRNDKPLTVSFQVDPVDPDLITGSVSTEDWSADLYADRAVFNRTNFSTDAGQYTMVLLGAADSSASPGGESYGVAAVDVLGRLRFAGSLADGTKVAQSAMLSKDGYWPLFLPLYRGGGSLYGWLQLNASSDNQVSGEATWVRPAMSWTWYYPAGFATINTAMGSRYTRPPRGTKVLDLINAQVQFNGADIGQNFTNHIALDSYNRVYNLEANELRLGFSLSNGAFSGWVRHPVNWDWVPFRGVVLQLQNVAAGYFPGWSQTGEVWLEGE